MKRSHEYQFTPRDVLRWCGAPLLPVLAFALVMHGGNRLRLWPPPRPTLDVDRTILVHQAEAARTMRDTEVLLLGDSSCLMDVSARALGEQLGQRALNLGTLSYLDLTAAATLLRAQLAIVGTNRLRTIVLLLNPEALRRSGPEPYHVEQLRAALAQEEPQWPRRGYERLSSWLGLETFRQRFLVRVRPASLPGAYGKFYGFSDDLEAWMTRERGSAVDPDRVPLTGNPEYRLARALESASRAFRAAVPPGVNCFAVITAVPERFAGPGYPAQHAEMLARWCDWLGAKPLALPATLPDDQFARVTHLRPEAVPEYTAALARALSPHLPPKAR